VIDPRILEKIRKELESIRRWIPDGARLLCERVIFPDEVPVIETCFLLVRPDPSNKERFLNLYYPALISLWMEEDGGGMERAIYDWLKRKETPRSSFRLKFLYLEVEGGIEIFIPNEVDEDWKYFMPRGERYTFTDLFA
jgi:hypothetical protein